jgi:DNA-binding transcriptional LysR family regulator
MVACGIGVALVPAASAAPVVDTRVRLVHLRHTATITLAAVWRTDSANAAVQALVAASDLDRPPAGLRGD